MYSIKNLQRKAWSKKGGGGSGPPPPPPPSAPGLCIARCDGTINKCFLGVFCMGVHYIGTCMSTLTRTLHIQYPHYIPI